MSNKNERMEKDQRESVVIYRSFIDACREIESKSAQLSFILGIIDYALDGKLPELTGSAKGMFMLVKPQIDANTARYNNGKKGGKPVTKTEPNTNLNLTKTKPNVNVNVNVNDNVNVNGNGETEPKVSPPDLSKSNLYRQPKVPTIEEVQMCFTQNGGTKEMADKFYEVNQSTGWYYKSSPITNFRNMVPGYVKAWTENESKRPPPKTNKESKTMTSEEFLKTFTD